MARASTVTLLPKDVRDRIARLLDESATLDDIILELSEMGYEISRSALHRYSQKNARLAENIRSARAAAEQLARDLGSFAEDDTGRFLVQIFEAFLVRFSQEQVGAEKLDLGSKQLMELARAFKDIQAAKRLTIEGELKIRRELAKEAAEAAGAACKAEGLSAESVDRVKAQVLGIAR